MRIKGFLGVLMLVAVSALLYAVDESSLQAVFDKKIQPYFETGHRGEFKGVAGVAIRYLEFPVPEERGAIVLLTGRNESTRKYAELLFDLRDQGYTIYTYDHRGQGYSGRLLADGFKGYVDSWFDYVADLKTFFDQVVNSRPHAKRILIGHSMGGCIATAFAEIYPRQIDRLVLCSPMFMINSGAIPEWVAYPLATTLSWLGLGASYAPGQKPPIPGGEAFALTPLMRSAARYAVFQTVITREPTLQLGGATNQWVREAMEMGYYVKDQIAKIEQPVLLLSAGTDLLVRLDVEDELAARLKQCRHLTWFAAKHELLMEQDPVRSEVIAQILSFIATN